MFLDLKHLFRKSIKLSYQSNLEDILDVVSNDLTSKLNTKKIFTLLNIPNKILPLLHLYANTIMSIRTNPRKPLFLMNSSSLFSRKFPFVTLNDKNVLMQTRSMLDITVTSKGIENNLNPHQASGPDQIKHITLQNLSTPLSPILKHLFQKSLDSEIHQSGRMLIWRLSAKR